MLNPSKKEQIGDLQYMDQNTTLKYLKHTKFVLTAIERKIKDAKVMSLKTNGTGMSF